MAEQRIHDGFIPGRYPIDAYGDGGFRFADMSHRGSILVAPSGIYAWKRQENTAVTAVSLEQDFSLIHDNLQREAADIDLLLIGTGNSIVLPSPGLRQRLAASGIRFEPMQTGAALRTYNILFEEQRRIAAAVIAVRN